MMNNRPSFEEVYKKYSYDPETGQLYSRHHKRTIGVKNISGYIQVRIGKNLYGVHRIAWLLHYKEWPKNQIDHIDGNPQNNKIVNLRDVSSGNNKKNRKINSNNRTGVRGVIWERKEKRWIAFISKNGKWRSLGRFKNVDDAINARKNAEKEFYGDFARVW